jgi:hypothetical protein
MIIVDILSLYLDVLVVDFVVQVVDVIEDFDLFDFVVVVV